MKTPIKHLLISCALIIGFISIVSPFHVSARYIDTKKKQKNNSTKLQGTQFNDLVRSTVSKIDFRVTNSGTFGYIPAGGTGGGFYPRGSTNQYIYGGGVWFAAQKKFTTKVPDPQDTTKLIDSAFFRKMSEISYNPNSGITWMSPGRIEDDTIKNLVVETGKYRTNVATKFNLTTGLPINAADGTAWSVWDARQDTMTDRRFFKDSLRYYGDYVYDVTKRNNATFPKGPSFVSNEDIFCVYKDTELDVFEEGEIVARQKGYPFKLQFEQTVYSWGFGEYANFLFIAYNIINFSNDTLRECWMAPAYDFDITVTGANGGAANDRVNYYTWDESLNLAYQWTATDGTAVERGRNFGYLGMDFMESPAVDTLTRFIRHDKGFYNNSEQIGLKTFRNWSIENDPTTDVLRYDFMALNSKDGDNGAGDKRFLMATGPFNMRPVRFDTVLKRNVYDTARVVVGVVFAPTARGGEATGDSIDLEDLIRRDRFAQAVYDNGFATPKPPELSNVLWEPINNGIVVKWDSTSEYSRDREEKGMDFTGYILFRAKQTDVDTFSVNTITTASDGKKRGPFGWKEIARWEVPSIYINSTISTDSTNINSPFFPRLFAYPTNAVTQLAAPAQVKTTFASLFPSLVLNTDISSNRSFLVYRRPNVQVAPWQQFWANKRVPVSYFEHFINKTTRTIHDSLALGIIRIRANGVVPNFPPLQNGSYTFAVIDSVSDILIRQVKNGNARLSWLVDDWEDSTKYDLRGVIKQYIDSVTKNRTFIDIGDDNGDGVITEETDITKTEKLINNVDYYYRVIGFDQGDYFQGTPEKENFGVALRNQIQAFPLAAKAGNQSSVSEVTIVDKNKIGGLYNFNLLIKDQDRFSTLFGGHEIELEFTRQMLPSFGYTEIDTFLNATPVEPKGLYTSQVRVKDVTTNRIIETYTVYYEPSECNFSRLFSESSLLAVSPSTSSWRANYASWLPDTSNFVSPFNRDKQLRIGRFTTDKLCNAPNQFMDGAFGFSFDFAIQQYGGYFRPFSMKVTNGNANTIISPSQERMADNAARLRADIVNNRWITHNQGPGNYEIEFLPGGQETITTRLTGDTQDRTYTLNYLNVRVRDLTNYKRPLLPTNDSADVNYGLGEIPHQTQSLPARYLVQGTSAQRPVDTVSSNFPLREVMTPSTFNLSAYGWVNGRFDPTSPNAKDGNTVRRNQAMNSNTGTPIGTQGRYYLSAIAGNDTLDFTHMLLIDGCEFTMDYAYKGGRVGGLGGRKYFLAADTSRPKSLPSVDFKAGDKVEIATFGGALGMPRDTARVRFKISPSDVASVGGVSQYTCDMLDQVLIVPNPYVISHIGQRSSYDAKIYFTKLPSECTIKIFTVNGDLIRTVNHVDTDGTSQQGMNFWDLLSDNRQRSVSQGLIAVIETPTCKTIKKFSIVVGGARIIGR